MTKVFDFIHTAKVGNDRARLIDVVTQLLPFIGYPRTNDGRIHDGTTHMVHQWR